MAMLASMSAVARWTLAALVMLGLWWLPVVNGVVCGALASVPATDRHENAKHALWTALALSLPLWAMQLYAAVWRPFANIPGFWRMILSLLALVATALVVGTARTTRRAI